MITASEIIENRKLKKAATIKQLNDSETEIRDSARSKILVAWTNIGEELVAKLENSKNDYCEYHGFGENGEITIDYYENFTDYSLKESIAKPFINAGYEVALGFPWDDWSGCHPGYMTIGLPGSLNEEFIIGSNMNKPRR